jgi:hypothetical protein
LAFKNQRTVAAGPVSARLWSDANGRLEWRESKVAQPSVARLA